MVGNMQANISRKNHDGSEGQAGKIKDALFYAGSQWGKAATPDEILSALDAAGFEVTLKSEGKVFQQQVTPQPKSGCEIQAAGVEGKIKYQVGAFDKKAGMASIEVWQFRTGQWHKLGRAGANGIIFEPPHDVTSFAEYCAKILESK